ncbi:hypothetical protein QYE76_069500 [Lolium multiflorum]|uniref:Uncharacterized protein n=1 Tax=Lolium multiflorum TaxID=4521 RepID=A0AAD8WDJ9_LOLMU|nr:hypothetical protein QYE76_069500 [Lolium multiflorum]
MASTTATSLMLIAVAFMVMCAASIAATRVKEDLPASFDVRQWRENAWTVGFDCFTVCTMGCFREGFPWDHCKEICAEECADGAWRYSRRLLQ